MRNILQKIKFPKLVGTLTIILIVLVIFLIKPKVDPENSSASNIFNFCQSNLKTYGTKEVCYSDQFKKLGTQYGADYSFKALHVLQSMDRGAVGCHLIAHGIGWGSYERDPSSWRTLIQNMSPACNYGAVHGVIESYINNLPSHSLAPEVIPTICGENPKPDCNHIIGHMLLVLTKADINKALNLCDVFVSPEQKDACVTGVFMEDETALNLVSHGLVPKSYGDWPARLPTLEKLCRSFSGAKAEGCWQEISHVALAKFNNDPVKTFAFCDSAQVPNGARRCVRHSIGIIGATKNFDLSSLKNICSIPQKNDPNFEENCYPALVSSSLSTIPSMAPAEVSFCSSLENRYQASCFSMIGTMGFYSPIIKNELPNACATVSADLKNYCLGLSSSLTKSYFLQTSSD